MKDHSLSISVVVCTRNRCRLLKGALDRLLKQEVNKDLDYEVIAVDNNSKNSTKEAIQAYMTGFGGRLKYVFEPRQGLSYARNKGIKESRGKIVAFTDDDCIVENK